MSRVSGEIERALVNKYATLTRGTNSTVYVLPVKSGIEIFVAPCTPEYYETLEKRFSSRNGTALQ